MCACDTLIPSRIKPCLSQCHAGLQYALPATWTAMAARGLKPELLSRWWSTFPAQLAGLGARKGAIAEGMDADFVVRSRARQALCPCVPTWQARVSLANQAHAAKLSAITSCAGLAPSCVCLLTRAGVGP